MTSFALRPAPRRLLRRPAGHRRRRQLDLDAELVSVAGALGCGVFDSAGRRVAKLEDLVVRWAASESHPPLVGIVVRARGQRRYVQGDAILDLQPGAVRLRAELAGSAVERQPWLVALGHDVLDRQIVDVDGAQIDRVSDLVLASTADGFRLVGADVSTRTLLMRVWPASLRGRVARERVFDWASVAAFSERGAGTAGAVLRLTQAAARLRERGPADLEALLRDLPPAHRARLAEEIAREPT